jgi:hypothetical protein
MLSQSGCYKKAASIINEQKGFINEAAATSLNKLFIMATSRECPHFAWQYALLVPQLPRLAPQACLSCLRQLETLPPYRVKIKFEKTRGSNLQQPTMDRKQ